MPPPRSARLSNTVDAPGPQPADNRLRVWSFWPGSPWAKTDVAYEVGPPDCVIRWTLERSGINTGIATQSTKCTWRMERQVPLLAALLAEMVAHEPTFRRVHFVEESPPRDELEVRIASAALALGWDARRGTPPAGRRLDRFLEAVLQDA
jgi:hypothetical protein